MTDLLIYKMRLSSVNRRESYKIIYNRFNQIAHEKTWNRKVPNMTFYATGEVQYCIYVRTKYIKVYTHLFSSLPGQDGNQGSILAFRPLCSVLPQHMYSMSPSRVKRWKTVNGLQSIKIDRRWCCRPQTEQLYSTACDQIQNLQKCLTTPRQLGRGSKADNVLFHAGYFQDEEFLH
jgi:hypothetical protein